MSNMRTRIDEIPVFEKRDVLLEAAHFNDVKVALKRLGDPLRFSLEDLRGLDVELSADLWVVADRTLNDLPILAWSHFETQGRDALHEPIPCQLRCYHSHAMVIVDKVFRNVHEHIRGRLLKRTA